MGNRIGVVIMRAQGYHDAHHAHIKRACAESDLVLVVLGSANKPKSVKNPFSVSQRMDMVMANVTEDWETKGCVVKIIPAHDHPNDDIWRANLLGDIYGYTDKIDDSYTLYGCEKDATSFYLQMFGHWDLSLVKQDIKVDATHLRELYFTGQQTVALLRDHPHISATTLMVMSSFQFNPDLQDEWNVRQKETEAFEDYPYPKCLNISCADAVVRVHGHILMIKRKYAPGRGCLALPGGHKDNNESYVECAVRELIEETAINFPEQSLFRNIIGTLLFDDPNRSGGTLTRISLGVLIDLSEHYIEGTFPVVCAEDDAAEVLWVKEEYIYHRNDVYDDHAKIVYELVTTFL